MKRMGVAALLIGLIMILAVPAVALAQGPGTDNGANNPAGQCVNFVDEDGDGICDNAGEGPQYGRMNRRGGAGQGMGYQQHNFEDADRDGQCDHFVDDNNDGVNDNAPGDGSGNRHGRGERGGGRAGGRASS